MKTIQPQQLPDSCCIIDVRTIDEHQSQRLKRAHIHIPLDQLSEAALAQKGVRKDQTLYMLCKGGVRAAKAAEQLSAAGYQQVCVIEGGLMNCMQQGVACASSGVMSIERQVRIIAGGVVVLGVVLGSIAAPVFYLISAAAGAGLIFSGITDWCGMAKLLAKAPWNKK